MKRVSSFQASFIAVLLTTAFLSLPASAAAQRSRDGGAGRQGTRTGQAVPRQGPRSKRTPSRGDGGRNDARPPSDGPRDQAAADQAPPAARQPNGQVVRQSGAAQHRAIRGQKSRRRAAANLLWRLLPARLRRPRARRLLGELLRRVLRPVVVWRSRLLRSAAVRRVRRRRCRSAEGEATNASVFVDGYYVGRVDEFDGVFQRLRRIGDRTVSKFAKRDFSR